MTTPHPDDTTYPAEDLWPGDEPDTADDARDVRDVREGRR